ncbi:MAG: DNA recombination protein RmuC [Pseudomonadota bacterium]|nr:DNA recombination protein RmuC [Pseudomonadota bacterium]
MTGSIEELLQKVGSDNALLILLLGVAMLSVLLGWLLARMAATRRIATLEAMLEYEMKSAEENVAALENSFSALSRDALRENNRSFLQLARQSMDNFHLRAESDLKLREQAVENLVRPLEQSLVRAEQQMREFDQGRRQAHGELNSQLRLMADSQNQLQLETRNLVQALRRPEVRGRWGELTLKRLVELSGMVEHCDFEQQPTVQGENGRLRPDLVVHLPAGRDIVVDVKTPLDAYLSALEANSDEARQQQMERHARQLRERIAELAGKRYWEQFSSAPDFVVLFIPGEQFLSAAVSRDPDLLEKALEKKVVLATPTSLVALLRTIAYGWRQERINENALKLQETAEEFHARLAVFSEHLAGLGLALEKTVASYNRGIGSYQRKLMPIARQFREAGVEKRSPAMEPEILGQQPARLAETADLAPDESTPHREAQVPHLQDAETRPPHREVQVPQLQDAKERPPHREVQVPQLQDAKERPPHSA